MFTPTTNKNGSRYVDPTKTLSNRTLRLSEWYVRHADQLKKIFTGILIAWCAVSIGIGLVGWGYYLFAGYPHVENILNDLGRARINTPAIHEALGPRALEPVQVEAFKNTPGKYDFLAHIKNSNRQWIGMITYEFNYGGGKTAPRTATVLPGKTQTAGAFGEAVEFFPSNVRMTITKTDWQHVNPHKIFDPKAYIESHVAFDVAHFTFSPADKTAGIATNRMAFDVTNNSAYSFWEPIFHVLYMNSGQVVGAKEISIASFKAGETRHVEISTLENTGRIDAIELIPLVNPFDESVFIPVGI